ncbi:SLIT and NTRK-like protein 5 [Paramacrobiotus metropolitanus]|uniref:SLIT and NTRK-like protein 5 n=1 Tax=Paramacrobiotus metropolitanus TaxID=2943436 RepID=UPI00244585B2|nr:SLIT and NTRK-like protein 5 [Paramacrobiotus metropolitanus]XP_055357698.1 SLIT and NTRK-like protein 5 [Paramacrobiotus metropolitanus]XP_055357699.1 SLIT and NTRK-like protein 5 [Paramacrobiotus metropolitanus]XP_055357700.1 SLIT and NTRK-like protein 5 [Paramacrobiotus metropolitanus]
MRNFQFSILAFVCLLLRTVTALCPQVCICDIDEWGRKRTRCENGGIRIPGTVDIQNLDNDVEVLVISGSRQNPNFINLEPAMFLNKRFKEIHLTYSDLERLSSSPFHYVSNTLQVLNLTNNRLSFAVEQNFRNLSRLTHLHLDYNRIEPVFSAMFNFLSSLKVLTMSNNLIREIPPRMALQLSQLEVLDLSSNPLGERQPGAVNDNRQPIPDTIFQDMPNLRVLRVANASLDGLPWPAIQKSVTNLNEVDLSANRIKEIKANQLSLNRKLEVAKLAGNPITRIEPNALSGMYLRYLDLSGINPNVLAPGVFQGARIVFLDISDMNLNNALNREVFLPISQDLKGLNISGNPDLALESRMFELFPNLEDLTMKRMNKGQLSNDFFGYQNVIQNLDLSENQLVMLDDGFFNQLSELTRLNLASNQLTSIPVNINRPKIQEIDLFNNRLTSFPDALAMTFASPSSRLQSLRLNSNPWHCDCSVAGLGRWLTRQDGSMNGQRIVCQGTGNFTCPVCQSPENLRGVPLDRATFLDSCTPIADTRNTGTANVDVIIAVVVCLIVLIIAVLLLVLWYRNRLHSYRTYEEKRKDADVYDQNGDAEVFAEDPGPISKPKSGVPASAPVKAPVKGAESDV